MEESEEVGQANGEAIAAPGDGANPKSKGLHSIPITSIVVMGQNEPVVGVINKGESFSVTATYQSAGAPDGLDGILLTFNSATINTHNNATSFAPANVTSQDPNAVTGQANNQLLATVAPTFDNSTNPPTLINIHSVTIGPITLNNSSLKSVIVNAQKTRSGQAAPGTPVTASAQIKQTFAI